MNNEAQKVNRKELIHRGVAESTESNAGMARAKAQRRGGNAKMSEWKEFKLGEVSEINPSEILPKGTVAKKVAMECLQPFSKKISNYSNEPYSGGVKFRNGNTLVARITPSLENGKTAYVDILNDNEIAFGSTEFIVLREKFGVSDKNFLYYFAMSPDFRDVAILSMTGSSGRQRVQTEVVIYHEFLLPPLPEQRAIAAVLSSLDDKIDLLHRQNKTLEAMVEALFRQWFENSEERIVNNEKWQEGKLGDYGKIICGKTPSKKIHSYFGGAIPFIKIPDMHGKVFVFDTEDTLTVEGASSQQNKFLPPKSISVSCIATVGLVRMNAFESQTNQQINTIIPHKNIYRYFLYLKFATMKEELLAMASGGTATDNLNTGDFSNIDIEKPEDKVLEIFHYIIEPYFDKIFANQIQIRNLEKLRDTLLPKLMSGEVRVEI